MKQSLTKKLIATVVAMVMILAVVPIVATADVEVPATSWNNANYYDTTWCTDSSATTYEIDTAAELAGFAYLSQTNSFEGKTVYITKDIDLGAHTWYGIGNPSTGNFKGSIEGKKDGVQGASVTIKNMTIGASNGTNSYGGAFISQQVKGTVSNLIFDNAYVAADLHTSVVCAWAKNSSTKFTNIVVKNSELVITGKNWTIAGFIIGNANAYANNASLSVTDCSVINSSIVKTAGNTAGSNVGFLVGNQAWGGFTFTNCNVLGCDFNNQSTTGTVNLGLLLGKDDAAGTITTVNCMVDSVGSYTLKNIGAIGSTAGTDHDITAPTMLDGASIRTTAESNGLRFTSVMSKANLDKLGATYSFGTVVVLASELTEGVVFTEAGLKNAGVSKYTTIKAVNGIYENYDGANGVKFNAALVDIADKGAEFAARSYVDVTENGLTIRVYSAFDAAKNERSMEYVANKALNDVKDVQEEATPNAFAYCFEVSEYNSDATGATCTMTAGTKYSCYAPAEWDVLKTWASVS